MKAVSLFTGIGGLDLAAHWAGIDAVAMCEIDPYCRRVLARHWPHVPIFEDVHDVTAESVRRVTGLGVGDSVDVVHFGFPCQDISSAGRGAGLGSADAPTGRSGIWFEALRVVTELRPRFVVAENVPALRTRGIDTVLDGLEAAGYTAGAFVVGSWAAGAPHRRNRVFVLGYRRCGIAAAAGADGMAHADTGKCGAGRGADGDAARCEDQCGDPGECGDAPRLADAGKGGRGSSNGICTGQSIADRHGSQCGAVADAEGGAWRMDGVGWQDRPDTGRAGTNDRLAYAERDGFQGRVDTVTRQRTCRVGRRSANGTTTVGRRRCPKSGLGRAAHGLPARLDFPGWPSRPGEAQYAWEAPRTLVAQVRSRKGHRAETSSRVSRLRAIGNAVNPHQAYPVMAYVATFLRGDVT